MYASDDAVAATDVPINEFKRMAAGAKLIDLKETLEIFGSAEKPGSIYKLAQDASSIWMEAGAIEKKVAPEEVINWTIIESILEEE